MTAEHYRIVAVGLVSLPCLIAIALEPHTAFGIALLCAFTAALARLFDGACAHPRIASLPHARLILAAGLSIAWTGILFVVAYILVPLVLQGSTEALGGLQKVAETVAKDFGEAWATYGPLLQTEVWYLSGNV